MGSKLISWLQGFVFSFIERDTLETSCQNEPIMIADGGIYDYWKIFTFPKQGPFIYLTCSHIETWESLHSDSKLNYELILQFKNTQLGKMKWSAQGYMQVHLGLEGSDLSLGGYKWALEEKIFLCVKLRNGELRNSALGCLACIWPMLES